MWAVEMSRTNGACVGLWRTLRGGLLLRFRVLLGLLHRRVERVQLLSGRDTRALWRCQLGAGANAGASHLFCAAMVGEHSGLFTHPSTERSSSIFGKLCEASSSILEGFGTYLVRPAAGLPLPSLRERRRRASQRVASQPSRPRASPGLVSARAVRARLRPSVSVRPEQEARTQVLVV